MIIFNQKYDSGQNVSEIAQQSIWRFLLFEHFEVCHFLLFERFEVLQIVFF